MAHNLPPAGITYPESDRFRNYLVHAPERPAQRQVTICCEVPKFQPPNCRADVRCRITDGRESKVLKVCPDCSDVITGFAAENDCQPREPLTQPGLLCYSGCPDRQRAPPPQQGIQCFQRCPERSRPKSCQPCLRQRATSLDNRPRLVKKTCVTHCYTYEYP